MSKRSAEAMTPSSSPGGQLVELEAILQVSPPPVPWSGRRTKTVLSFRGRVNPGLAQLPAIPLAGIENGITFGLASAPVILKSLSGTHPVPANAPWAVANDGTWKVVFTRVTDLRLIHGNGAVMNAPPHVRRPFRFRDDCERAMRAAINAATPVWVDDRCRPVANLASLHPSQVRANPSAVRPVGASVDHDTTAAFVMLATWAFEQHARETDPRVERVVDHIDTHLGDPALSTDSIAAGCGISRRTLQSVLAGYGGVACYLRRRRLEAAVEILTAGDQMPDLDEVARATGLGSRRTFERAIRQVYGLTPRQARAQVLAGFPLRERESGSLEAS